MPNIEFDTHRVGSRKDVLHFVEETLTDKVYEGLVKNTERWIEELTGIYYMLTGEDIVAGVGINYPPLTDPDFKNLGGNVFLYRGTDLRSKGLWVSEETTTFDLKLKKEVPCTQWTHYNIGARATLTINKNFKDVPIETFLPENFEPKSKAVKTDKRPICTFNLETKLGEITVYAKGADVSTYKLYHPPSWRLTNLSQVIKTTSEKEMNMTLELAAQGVKVPTVVGYYAGPVEEFLFLQEVKGKSIPDFLDSHRSTIIEQDAQMLAALCMLGYKKCGFVDFDDKVFDGKNLYLIDVDELRDMYWPAQFDFRQMLLNPADTSDLDEFRTSQRKLFTLTLRDAIYNYKGTLTPTLEDKALYINSFFQRVGWKKPTKAEIKEITTFPKNYETWERSLSMMCDSD